MQKIWFWMILVYGWNRKSGSSSASRNGTQPWHGHNHSFVFTLAFILGGLERGMIGLNDNRRSAIVSSRFFFVHWSLTLLFHIHRGWHQFLFRVIFNLAMSRTFCNSCYLGVVSAGDAGGHGSELRRVMLRRVLRSAVFDDFSKANPQAQLVFWSMKW